MGAFLDHRDGKTWRYRKLVTLLDRTKERIKGTPKINTKNAAEAAERAHIELLLNPAKAIANAAAVAEATRGPSITEPTIATLIDLNTKGGTWKGIEREPYDSGAPRANRGRARILNAEVRAYFGHMRPSEIEQAHLDDFRNKMRKKPGKKPGTKAADQTVRNKCFAITGLIEWAFDIAKILAGPRPSLTVDVQSTKAQRDNDDPEVLPMSLDEIEELLAATEPGDHRYRVAILLAADSGLRIGEIIGARWTDIDGNFIRIVRQITPENDECLPKGKKTRTVPLSKRTLAELAKLRRVSSSIGYIVTHSETDNRSLKNPRVNRGEHMSYSGLYSMITGCYDRAHIRYGTIEDKGIVSPWHSLRHTYGTQLVAEGAQGEHIQRLMGHKDYRTTQRYITVTKEQLLATVRRAIG